MKEILEKIEKDLFLCQCNEIKYKNLFENINGEPPRFENFLIDNNLGNRCTSCLPDCEIFYHFLQKNINEKLTIDKKNKKLKKKDEINFKNKLYNFIDAILPEKLIEYKAYIPIIISEKIDTCIVSGNFAYPFNKLSTSKKKIFGKVYDTDGNLFWKFENIIEPNKLLRLKIPKSNKKNLWGFAEISSKFFKKGLQGTKRIHFNVISKESISQLHSSSPQTIKDIYVEYICNQNLNEKIYLLVSNVHKENNVIEIFDNNNLLIENFELKSKETKLIQLPKKIDKIQSFKKPSIKSVRLKSSLATGLMNIIYSTDDHDFISVDHVDPHQFTQRTSKLNKKMLNNL